MSDFMSLITENFWFLLLVLTMLLAKQHRPVGIIMLTIYVVWGFVPWTILLLVGISVFIEILRWNGFGSLETSSSKSNSKGIKTSTDPKTPPAPPSKRNNPDYTR